MRGLIDTDQRIAVIAGRQHGVVARWQLIELGLSEDAIERRLAAGRLHRLHRGVYAVGHTVLRIEGHWMAATLATDGVLSHATAAAAWDLRRRGSGAIHVTVESARRRAGLRVHRTRIAELHRRPIPSSLQAVLSLYTAGSTVTRSEMEERFLALCDDHRIRRPDVNTRIEGTEVDFVWRDARLVVEVDGYAYHRSPSSFESDRERDVILALAGWQVLRFTWTQLTTRPAWVAAALTKRVTG